MEQNSFINKKKSPANEIQYHMVLSTNMCGSYFIH